MPIAPSILVTDGNERAALSLVRSLGRRSSRVYVCSPRPRSLAGASRHVLEERQVPDPLVDPAAFVEAIRTAVERWKIDVLLPVSDASLLAVLEARSAFVDVCLPFAVLETYRRVSNKDTLLARAASLGIATPGQIRLERPSDRIRLLHSGMPEFPLVIKPARSVVRANGRLSRHSVKYATDPGRLWQELDRLGPEAFPVLVQRRIEGPGIGVFLLLWEGRTLAVFSHQRLREKPPSGGVSVYRVSIPADPGLVARSIGLLRSFDWQGVAMVEYKVDAATGTPYLMEVNGRFWGSLQLAIDAGVDFPGLLVAAALGREPSPVREYRAGVRCRWWWGDVDQLLTRLRTSATDHALAPPVGRGRALLEFVRASGLEGRNEVLRWSDPWPFIRESIDWFARS